MKLIRDGVGDVENAFNAWKEEWEVNAKNLAYVESLNSSRDYFADFILFLVGTWLCSHHLKEE